MDINEINTFPSASNEQIVILHNQFSHSPNLQVPQPSSTISSSSTSSTSSTLSSQHHNISKRNHISLKNYQKLQICLQKERHPQWSQQQLASWVQSTYSLPITPKQNTISTILKNKQKYLDMNYIELNGKRKRATVHRVFDQSLGNWMVEAEGRGKKISVLTMRKQAVMFARYFKMERHCLQLSNGWHDSFKRRYSLKEYNKAKDMVVKEMNKLHSVDEVNNIGGNVEPRLEQDVVQETGFDIVNYCYLCEFDLCYNLRLDGSAEESQSYLSIILCFNSTGEYILPPAIVLPPSLQLNEILRLYNEEDVIFFTSSSSSSGSGKGITQSIFKQWIRKLNTKLLPTNRKIRLFLSNSYRHAILELPSIEFIKLNVQLNEELPIRSIIDSFKMRYRRYQIVTSASKMELSNIDYLDVSLKDAIKWILLSIQTLPNKLIQSLFEQSFESVYNHNDATKDVLNDDEEKRMELKVNEFNELMDAEEEIWNEMELCHRKLSINTLSLQDMINYPSEYYNEEEDEGDDEEEDVEEEELNLTKKEEKFVELGDDDIIPYQHDHPVAGNGESGFTSQRKETLRLEIMKVQQLLDRHITTHFRAFEALNQVLNEL